MKILSNLKSGFSKALVAMMVASPAVVSCYDDTYLRDMLGEYGEELEDVEGSIDGVKDNLDNMQNDLDWVIDKLYELEEKLNNELAALSTMLNGQLFISKVSRNVSTGITTVTLSDGSTLQLLPQTNLQSMVTYINIGGAAYWAYIDENGAKQLFLNSDGEAFPVASVVPEVIVKEDKHYLVLDGMEYPLGGNSIFSDYKVMTDELTGEVYAVTFTFGDDMTFTVTVDGACGFYFVMSSGAFGQMNIINDYYVPAGKTEKVQINAKGVVDYVLQIPAGWKVKESVDVYTSERYFNITAPALAAIEAGYADAEGDLKVISVLEGGKASITKLYLSSSAFKNLNVSMGKVYLEMNNGLQKYVCGVCPVAEYDEASIFDVASGLLTAYDYPEGYKVLTSNIKGANASEIAGKDLELGTSYVFWAIPALYFSDDDDAGYYLEEGTISCVEFTNYDAALKVLSEAFKDITVSLKLAGAQEYYAALLPKDDYYLPEVLYSLNLGLYTPKAWTYGQDAYEGSVFTLTGVTAVPATDYVLWVAIAESGKEYSESDLLVAECSTITLTPGGSTTVVASEPEVVTLEIVTELTAAGAESIYYKYLTVADANKYTDDIARADFLMQNGVSIKESTVIAKLSESGIKVKPSTKYVLFALAADAEGKYGPVLVLECSTTEIMYNDIQVNLSILRNDPGNVVISVDSDGTDEFVYWIGRTSDNTWKSSTYLGGSVETAQAYLYLNSTQYRITSVMEKYPIVNGQLVLTDLPVSEEHVIIVMGKAADGTFSQAASLFFEPSPVSLGQIVKTTDAAWAPATSQVKVDFIPEAFAPASGFMPGDYAYYLTLPLNYTAYVVSGTYAYFEAYGINLEKYMIEVITAADSKMDTSIIVDPSKDYPYDSDFYHFPHGSAQYGYRPGAAVIWASQEFHDKICPGHEEKTEITANGKKVPCTTLIYLNNGEQIKFKQPNAIASTSEVIDRVFVLLQDLDGNCYEPIVFDVPIEGFLNASVPE